MAQSFSGCLLVSVLVTKPDGSHAPWLNVWVTAALPDADGYLRPGGSTILVLHDGVLWTLIDAEVVYAGEQQPGEPGVFQAATGDPSFYGHLKGIRV